MKNWKAIQLDYANLADYDDVVPLGVCLTQRQVAILKALLTTAYWTTRWNNLSVSKDVLESEIAQLDSQLDGNDCGGFNMQFRDNPLDPCEVQYSLDLGETWQTMFRKDICPTYSPIDITNITNTKTVITVNNTTWDNDIINIAPEWEYEDPDSDKALCWVIDFYVEWICETAIQTIQSDNVERRKQNDWWDDVLESFSAGLVAALAFINLPAAAVAAVAWAAVNIANEIFDLLIGKSWEQFTDDDAKQVVKCWMWGSVRGETPQWEDWTTSLDDFVPVGDNQTAIAEVVDAFNSETDIYINYMLTLEDINTISDTLPECPCELPMTINQLAGPTGLEWYGTRFTNPTGLAFSNPGDTPAVCPGVYSIITQRYNGVPSSIGGVGCNVRVTLPLNVLVTTIRVLWGTVKPLEASAGDKNAAIYLGKPYDDGVYVGGYSWNPGWWPDQQVTTTIFDVELVVTTPRTHVYVHNSINRPNGNAYLQWIQIICIPYLP